MLAWRPILRPPNIARRVIQHNRRPIHSTLPRAQPQPRPPGVLAKLRFRADGQPRSRWVGLAIGTLLVSNYVTLTYLEDLLEEADNLLGVLTAVVGMSKADMEYGPVDLDSLIDTYTYYKRMYQAFSQFSDAELDPLFRHFTRLLESSDENDTEAKARLHQITRKAAEEICKALHEQNVETLLPRANYILMVMLDTLQLMLEVVQDEEDDSDIKYAFQLIKGRPRKDSGSSPKDYEVLG